jgi:hypothetical protein
MKCPRMCAYLGNTYVRKGWVGTVFCTLPIVRVFPLPISKVESFQTLALFEQRHDISLIEHIFLQCKWTYTTAFGFGKGT